MTHDSVLLGASENCVGRAKSVPGGGSERRRRQGGGARETAWGVSFKSSGSAESVKRKSPGERRGVSPTWLPSRQTLSYVGLTPRRSPSLRRRESIHGQRSVRLARFQD